MKIITKCIIDIKTLCIEYEKSYIYNGPIAECKGGGGGGSSGAVEYPDYVEEIHCDWLDGVCMHAGTAISSDITEVMNSALGGSPWTGLSAYDPDADIAAFAAIVLAFGNAIDAVDPDGDWMDMYDLIKAAVPASTDIAVDDTEVDNAAAVFDADGVTEMAIVTDVDAFSDQMNDEIDDKILPRFRRGMQNIGAVVSSAFPLGEALIYAFGARDVAKYNGDLRVAATLKNADVDIAIMNKNLEVSKSNLSKDVQVALANMNKDIEIGKVNAHKDLDYERLYISGTEQMVNFIAQKFGWLSNYTQFAVESNRIKIVAKSEQAAKDAEIDENDALWDLEVFQYGANLLAAPAGGTAVTRTKASGNTGASVLGGAMSGAAAGSMISPGIGTVVGAVVGGAAGYFMS